MIRQLSWMVAAVATIMAVSPQSAQAGLTSHYVEPLSARVASGDDYLEAQEYRIADIRESAGTSVHQSVTAWRVTSGSWNGQVIDGLSLVLVRTQRDDGAPTATNCYISYPATLAQKNALLSAYVSSRQMSATDVATWRVESAVITFEFVGQTLTVHLGIIT